MTRREFDHHFAATPANWLEAPTLDLLNDRAFAALQRVSVDDADPDTVRAAFDKANRVLA